MIKLISLWPYERYFDEKEDVVDCVDCVECEEGLGVNYSEAAEGQVRIVDKYKNCF
jgi:hypothetical protein